MWPGSCSGFATIKRKPIVYVFRLSAVAGELARPTSRIRARVAIFFGFLGPPKMGPKYSYVVDALEQLSARGVWPDDVRGREEMKTMKLAALLGRIELLC